MSYAIAFAIWHTPLDNVCHPAEFVYIYQIVSYFCKNILYSDGFRG